MDNYIKVSACAVSHPGMGYSANVDNFYLNGRSRFEYEMENIQVSIDGSAGEYIFAVSDDMDRMSAQKTTSVSMMKELRKFQENIKGKGGDVKSKLNQLGERVNEINNVIFSMMLNSSEDNIANKDKATAVAALFIMGYEAAILALGSCRIYSFRNGYLKNLTGDNKKTDRLLRMGIITDEQAKELSTRLGKSAEEAKTGIYKSETISIIEGDIFLLCSDGIYSGIDDERIFEILSGQKEVGLISNMLVKEALKNGIKDSVTSLIIKIEEVKGSNKPKVTKELKSPEDQTSIKQTEDQEKIEHKSYKSNIKQESKLTKKNKTRLSLPVRRLIAGTIIGILIAIIALVVIYKPWTFVYDTLQVRSDTGEPTKHLVKPTVNATVSKKPSPTLKDENTATGVQEDIKYVVKSGDNLQKISLKFYNTIDRYKDIMQVNNITDPNQLAIGEVLIIPK